MTGAPRRYWLIAPLVQAGWAPGAVLVLHVLASQVFFLLLKMPRSVRESATEGVCHPSEWRAP